jgi:hypothetical protein
MTFAQVPVLIPSYQPGEALETLVEALLDRGFETVTVVNDGSGPEFDPIFQRVRDPPHVFHRPDQQLQPAYSAYPGRDRTALDAENAPSKALNEAVMQGSKGIRERIITGQTPSPATAKPTKPPGPQCECTTR